MLVRDGMIKNVYVPKDKRLSTLKKKKPIRKNKEDIITMLIIGLLIFIFLIA